MFITIMVFTTSWVEITAGSGSGDGVSVGTVIHWVC